MVVSLNLSGSQLNSLFCGLVETIVCYDLETGLLNHTAIIVRS